MTELQGWLFLFIAWLWFSMMAFDRRETEERAQSVGVVWAVGILVAGLLGWML